MRRCESCVRVIMIVNEKCEHVTMSHSPPHQVVAMACGHCSGLAPHARAPPQHGSRLHVRHGGMGSVTSQHVYGNHERL